YLLRSPDAETLRDDHQIIPRDVGELAVHRHEVLICPFALRVKGVSQVVRWGKFPSAALAKQERHVLCMVVAIGGHDVECDASKRLLHTGVSDAQAFDCHQQLTGIVSGLLS